MHEEEDLSERDIDEKPLNQRIKENSPERHSSKIKDWNELSKS